MFVRVSSFVLFSGSLFFFFFFFFNDTATTEIYTLSLHDALPICCPRTAPAHVRTSPRCARPRRSTCRSRGGSRADRKSTRLNSSHSQISYAVFCLKKKKKTKEILSIIERTDDCVRWNVM